MEIKTGISLQTKQVLSQMQVESLNILAMSMTELKDFLQKEEIENPLLEFSAERGEEAAPVTYKETERFYKVQNGKTAGRMSCMRSRTAKSPLRIW